MSHNIAELSRVPSALQHIFQPEALKARYAVFKRLQNIAEEQRAQIESTRRFLQSPLVGQMWTDREYNARVNAARHGDEDHDLLANEAYREANDRERYDALKHGAVSVLSAAMRYGFSSFDIPHSSLRPQTFLLDITALHEKLLLVMKGEGFFTENRKPLFSQIFPAGGGDFEGIQIRSLSLFQSLHFHGDIVEQRKHGHIGTSWESINTHSTPVERLRAVARTYFLHVAFDITGAPDLNIPRDSADFVKDAAVRSLLHLGPQRIISEEMLEEQIRAEKLGSDDERGLKASMKGALQGEIWRLARSDESARKRVRKPHGAAIRDGIIETMPQGSDTIILLDARNGPRQGQWEGDPVARFNNPDELGSESRGLEINFGSGVESVRDQVIDMKDNFARMILHLLETKKFKTPTGRIA